jgi:hypothetical protein
MGARKFCTDPSQLFVNAGSADVIAFNRGVRLVMSVSNPSFGSANYAKALPGGSVQVANDAAWNALFTRINPAGTNLLKYSAAVDTTGANLLGSYGGINWPNFELIIEHEVDRPDKKVVAADFIAYWKHVYGLAVTAGVRQYINFNWCVTVNDGIRLGRVDPFFPGTAWVDTIGLDYYSDFTASWAFDGSVTPFSTRLRQVVGVCAVQGFAVQLPRVLRSRIRQRHRNASLVHRCCHVFERADRCDLYWHLHVVAGIVGLSEREQDCGAGPFDGHRPFGEAQRHHRGAGAGR